MDAIAVSPTKPDSKTPVTISFSWGGCIIDSGFEKTAHTFHLYVNYSDFCFAAPPGGIADIPVGALQAGMYNVVYDVLTEGVLQETYTLAFTVTPAAGTVTQIPVFGAGAACILTVVLVLGVALFRRASNG
jgi:hypothetical protein